MYASPTGKTARCSAAVWTVHGNRPSRTVIASQPIATMWPMQSLKEQSAMRIQLLETGSAKVIGRLRKHQRKRSDTVFCAGAPESVI